MKCIKLLLTMAVLAVMAIAQDAQTMPDMDMSMGESAASVTNPNGYKVTFTQWPAVTDATAYVGGTASFWKAMATKSITGVTYSPWGTIYVLSGGCVFTYNPEASSYTQLAWGCGFTEITSRRNATYNLVALLVTDGTCPSGTKRLFWSYNGAAPSKTSICDTHIRGGIENNQLELNYNGAGHLKFYNGTGYIELGTAAWIDGNTSDKLSVCAFKVDAGVARLYTLNAAGKAMEAFTPGPPVTGAGVTSCLISQEGIFVTDAGKGYWYKPDTHSWVSVTGAGITSPTGFQKSAIFAVQSSQLKHFNVYAGYIAATLSGSYTGCPTDAIPCTHYSPPPTHTKTIRIHFPDGLRGQMKTYASVYSDGTPITSDDLSPTCDPLFGPPGDLACLPPVTGGVSCSIAGPIFGAPPPPQCHDTACKNPSSDAKSHDARSYTGDGFAVVTASAEEIVGNRIYAVAYAKCEADVPACAPGTPPAPLICPATSGIAPGGHPFFGEIAECNELAPYTDCGKTIVEQRAVGQCKNYLHGYGFIEFIAGYDPADPAGPLCYPLPIVKHLAPPVNFPCHEELH